MVSDALLIMGRLWGPGLVSIRFEVRGGFRPGTGSTQYPGKAFQSALRFAVVSDDGAEIACQDDQKFQSALRFAVV